MKKTLITVFMALAAVPMLAQRVSVDQENLLDIGKVQFCTPSEGVFELTNNTDQPMVIDRVDTGCGCTKAVFQQGTIAPGEKYSITVIYDARTLGHFDRIIDVYTKGSDTPIALEFRGHVVKDVEAELAKSLATTATKKDPAAGKADKGSAKAEKEADPFPEKIGELLADCNAIEFEDVRIGEVVKHRFHIHNPTKETVQPQLMHLPSYMKATISPSKLRPNQTAEVTLTFDSNVGITEDNIGLLQNDIYLGKNPGVKVSKETRIPVSAVITPSVSASVDVDATVAPKLEVSDNVIMIKKKKKSETITLTNNGPTPLEISRIQPFTPGLYVELEANTIAAGQSAKMKVTVVPKEFAGFATAPRILLVTNDPENPTVFIDIKNQK